MNMTKMKVLGYLRETQEASTTQIASAIGGTRSCAWNALNRLQKNGVVQISRRQESNETARTRGVAAAIWSLQESAIEFPQPELEESEQSVSGTLVQRAMASQPLLATVWHDRL